MSEIEGLPLADVPGALWDAARRARHRLLMADYDGTLAPFRVERSGALPLPRSLELLERISRHPRTALAIVSGRPIRELETLLGPLEAVLVGEHGWESKQPRGPVIRHPVPDPVAAALDRAAGAAERQGLLPGLERKRASVAFHVRGLDPAEAADLERRCRSLWAAAAELPGLRLVPSEQGLELRATGHDKGTAALALIAGSPPRTLPVYIGDDHTDEDAFDVVRGSGYGLRVGADGRPSHATGRLASCEDVAEFLARWLEVVEGEPPPSPD